jgi:single-stranded DNA-binding protein
MKVQIDCNVCQDIKKISEKFYVLRVAENYKKDKDAQESTFYLDVKVFERTIPDIEYFEIQKGDRLLIEGKLVEDEFESNGEKRKQLAVIADSIKKVWKKTASKKEDKYGF